MPGIGKPPDVFPDLLPIWHAWHELSISRQSGFSPVGIPWAEMSAFCADNGVAGPLRVRWIRLMRAMDREFLMIAHEKAKPDKERRGKSRNRD